MTRGFTPSNGAFHPLGYRGRSHAGVGVRCFSAEEEMLPEEDTANEPFGFSQLLQQSKSLASWQAIA
jgi:hypothetical protein